MLARFAAVINLLVKAGYDETDAAQMVMRKLLASGVAPPRQGGDARGWKCLLLWRADLSFGLASDEAQAEYRAFTRELERIPANVTAHPRGLVRLAGSAAKCALNGGSAKG